MPWGYAAAAVGGALVSSQGAKSAANTQAAAQIQAANTQKQMFNKISKQEQPFLRAGYGASQGLSQLFGRNGSMNKGYGNFNYDSTFKFNPKDLNKVPGYQFQLKQGDRALQSSDATTTGALSGATMKDLMSFNQNLAGTYENQYYNQALSSYQNNYANALSNYQTNQGNYYANQNNIFNRLNQITQMGQNAAANLGGNATQLGTGIAQAQAAAGGSVAAGQIGSANAYAGAVNNIPLYALMAGNTQNGDTPPPQEGPPSG